MSYSVFSEEVFGQPHEQEERHKVAEFESYDEAVAYCKSVLKKELEEVIPQDRAVYYEHHGMDYFIVPEPDDTHFSSRDFVKTLCV
jgi:hypothetical protein